MVILVSAVLVLSCGQTDRETDRETDKITHRQTESQRRIGAILTVSSQDNKYYRYYLCPCPAGEAKAKAKVLPEPQWPIGRR